MEMFGNNIRDWAIFGFGIFFLVLGLGLVLLVVFQKLEPGKAFGILLGAVLLAAFVMWASFDITDTDQRVLQGAAGGWFEDLFTKPFGGGN